MVQMYTNKRQKIADLICEDVKRWIVRENLKPGDRLPNEKALMERYECAKATIREALHALEVEGLVILKTGPGGGAIINAASVQGLQSQRLVPAYAASKGGVLSLTRQMALDYASENIRVLAVCPGAIDTKMLRTSAETAVGDPNERIAEWGKGHPIGRIGTGLDVANVVLFLASDKASFMTGEYVCVDGGMMAKGAWA